MALTVASWSYSLLTMLLNSADYMEMNYKIINNDELERMWKEAVLVQCEILSWYADARRQVT